MADVRKILDQSGVSVLWTRVIEQFAIRDEEISGILNVLDGMNGKIDALERGTYDDSELRGLVGANTTAIETNTNDIATLKGTGDGSVTSIVAEEIAKIVAGADTDFDTLKEIADWIKNDTTGAASMANDIAALEELVGSTSVAEQIQDALKTDGVDKYALASELNSLVERIGTLETADYATKIEAQGYATAALNDAKAYTDSEITRRVVALTEEEIDAILNSVG